MGLRERLNGKKSFILEGHANELEHNQSVVIVEDKGDHFIDLILEPNMFERLSSECRLTADEYVDAVERFMESEQKDWHELRMKDQINMTRDEIIKDTILKYVREHNDIKREDFDGIEISYNKRYQNDQYIGEAVIITMSKL